MHNDELFNRYVDNFKKLPTYRKKKETIEEFKKILAMFHMMRMNYGTPDKILFNREIADTTLPNIPEDDFVEACFVYAHMIQESMSEYVANKEGLED